MDAIEKRARELLADIANMPWNASEDEVVALIAAALTPPEGHVVVTRNEAGQAVAVTRQDAEGRILSVIAEFGPPEGYALVPAIPSYEITKALAGTAGCNLAQAALAYRDALAACPEVP